MAKMNVLVGTAESWIALQIVRSLGRKGITVDCASNYPDALSFHSRYCSGKYSYSSPSDGGRFVDDVIGLLEKKDYVLPYFTNEETLIPLSKERERVQKHTSLYLPPHETLKLASDKGLLMEFSKKHGIPCPMTYKPSSVNEAVEYANQMGYPVVIKPTSSSNARGVNYCKNREELKEKWVQVEKEFPNTLLQEFIPPGGGAMGFEALFNDRSELKASFIHKRIREFPITGGPSTLRESVEHPPVKEYGVKLLSLLGWQGVAMVEFRIDPRDGVPKLMEINPRFWGSLALSIASGVDFPYLLFKLVAEGDIPNVDKYKVGVKCRHLLPDLRHLRQVMLHGPAPGGKSRLATLLSFIPLVDGCWNYDVESIDDPGPSIYEFSEPFLKILRGR